MNNAHEKERIRREALARRRAMSVEDRSRQSTMIAEKLFALPGWMNAKTVGLYASAPDEVSTDEIIYRAIESGKIVALPRVLPPQSPLNEGGSEAAAEQGGLMWHVITVLDDLAVGAFGIREPRETAPMVDIQNIDLIVVPGVAFDTAGHRIGYGGGFYDRALAGCDVPTVALAFSSQIIEAIPTEAHDRLVDVVLTSE